MMRGLLAGLGLLSAGLLAGWSPSATPIVTVVGTDYAFTAPAQVAPGRIAFRFVNQGKHRHELNVARLKPGVSVDDYVKAVQKGITVRPLIEGSVGVLFAEPGESSYSQLVTDATPGSTLAVICIFRDSPLAQRHFAMGMYTRINVSRLPIRAPSAAVREDTVLASEYAFRYPHKLAAGSHTIVFRNVGKVRHELSIDMLAKGVTLARLQAAEKKGAKVDSLLDKSIGVLHAYGGQSPLGKLTFDVVPGREYLIGCYFKDDDKSPEHYALGMFGAIKGVPRSAAAR